MRHSLIGLINGAAVCFRKQESYCLPVIEKNFKLKIIQLRPSSLVR